MQTLCDTKKTLSLLTLDKQPDDEFVGQNVAILTNSENPFEEAVAKWYAEGLGYDFVMTEIKKETGMRIFGPSFNFSYCFGGLMNKNY